MFCSDSNTKITHLWTITVRRYIDSSLRALFVGGEHCDADTSNWAAQAFKTALLNHWWQTETGHPMTAPCVGLDTSLHPPAGSTGLPVPGWDGMMKLVICLPIHQITWLYLCGGQGAMPQILTIWPCHWAWSSRDSIMRAAEDEVVTRDLPPTPATKQWAGPSLSLDSV